ncbi:MAG: hypothetical protein R3A11_07140 [Bdellovibrionota bacterium]
MSRSPRFRIQSTCVLMLMLVPSLCFSSVFLHQTPEELAAQSDLVFVGKVVSMYSSFNGEHDINTYVKIKVYETAKGEPRSERLVVVPGGQAPFQGSTYRRHYHGAAAFHEGEEVMVMVKIIDGKPVVQYFGSRFLLRTNEESGEKEFVREVPPNVEIIEKDSSESSDGQHTHRISASSAYMTQEVYSYKDMMKRLHERKGAK